MKGDLNEVREQAIGNLLGKRRPEKGRDRAKDSQLFHGRRGLEYVFPDSKIDVFVSVLYLGKITEKVIVEQLLCSR